MTAYLWEDPALVAEPLWKRAARLALVGAAHVAVVAAALTLAVRPEFQDALRNLDVRLIEPPPPPPPPKAEAKPPPPAPRPVVRRPVEPPPQPVPVMTAPESAPASPSGFTVPAQPPPAPVEIRPAPPAAPAPPPPPVTAARFDADYLHNPKPAYPLVAKRRREQGTVMLSVRVGADGKAQSVEVRTSSGSALLDESALEAVRQWRFVPARRGEEPIASSVIVPIRFALQD